ncbi:MAG: hypothetical protein Q8S20_12660 [Sulfuritalea sp.]|nr:hypothetical protein [Sulfuritalea sp.]
MKPGNKRHQVGGQLVPALDARPQLNRRVGDKLAAELNSIQIVVQVLSLSALLRIAGHADAGRAFTPMANPADVLTGRVGKEDVGSPVPGLRLAFELPGFGSKSPKVEIIRDSDKQIGVLRIGFVGCQRPDQSNPFDAGHRADGVDKAKGFRNEECPNSGIDWFGMPAATHSHDGSQGQK